MRPPLLLGLVIVLLFPSAALAGNDYPGGGGLAAPGASSAGAGLPANPVSSGPGLPASPSSSGLGLAAAPATGAGLPAAPASGGPGGPPAAGLLAAESDASSQTAAVDRGLLPGSPANPGAAPVIMLPPDLTTAALTAPARAALGATSSGSTTSGLGASMNTRGSGLGNGTGAAALFPSAAQPSTSTVGQGGATLSPGQLYPSAAQPSTSTAGQGGATVSPGQLFPSAIQPTTSTAAQGGAMVTSGQLYPSANQPSTSSMSRPVGAVGGAPASGSTTDSGK